MRYIYPFIFIFVFSALCNSTELPDHYTFPKNYNEGVYTESFKDNLLVAQNDNTDSRFYKSVVILLEHDEKGAIGFAINKLLGEYPLSSLVTNNNKIKNSDKKKLDKVTLPIFWGGPLDGNKIFVLHSNDYVGKSTKVYNSLSVSNDLKILIDISNNNGPKESLIIIGISAWAENQLEGEIERDQWFLGEFDSNLIFNDENKSKWDLANKRVFVPL
tara:strand:- start:345 stop:992 length:648 start_codon:yes stop_codon:yes gene_type:complete